jgi:hypothetical protein
MHFPMIVQLRPSIEENISQERRKKKNNKASKQERGDFLVIRSLF